MELKFLTPTEVWESFIPSEAPLEPSIISAETADNLVRSKQYFTAEETPQGKVRAYMEIFYDARWTDPRAALLLLAAKVRKGDEEIVRTLVKEGYAVGVLDYNGGVFDGEDKTAFPQDLSFACYPECNLHLDKIETSARNTPWFVWSKISRRALLLLAQQMIVDETHIGVIGVGIGAHLAWQVTGMDSRVRALVTIGGGGYRWAQNKPRFIDGNVPSSDEERAYSTGVGAETYAKFVKCPVLFIASRTAHTTDVDRAGDILSLVNTASKQLLITSSNETQLTKTSLAVMLNWLRGNFVLSGTEAINPTAEFDEVGGKLYLRMNTVHKAQKISVFVCYGETSSSARHWIELDKLQKVDVHVYTVGIPVYDADEFIVAYATCIYADGNAASTPIQGVFPKKIGVTSVDPLSERYRILYDGSMGLGSFSCLTQDEVVDEANLTQAEGPFEITGITAKKGGLYFCRSAAEIRALARTSILHFDAYTPSERELCINMYTYPEMKRYTAYADLTGGEFWQKILLRPADFKSEEGKTLAKFSDTKILALPDAEGVILNNFLWI